MRDSSRDSRDRETWIQRQRWAIAGPSPRVCAFRARRGSNVAMARAPMALKRVRRFMAVQIHQLFGKNYQRHVGSKPFEPRQRPLWTSITSGWCSLDCKSLVTRGAFVTTAGVLKDESVVADGAVQVHSIRLHRPFGEARPSPGALQSTCIGSFDGLA
jgi:hypothetical protein